MKSRFLHTHSTLGLLAFVAMTADSLPGHKGQNLSATPSPTSACWGKERIAQASI